MFVQGEHIDIVTYAISACLLFDLSLTFWPLTIFQTKRYRGHFGMFVQGEHIDIVTYAIPACL